MKSVKPAGASEAKKKMRVTDMDECADSGGEALRDDPNNGCEGD